MGRLVDWDDKCLTTVYVPSPNRMAVTLWVDGEAYSIETDCPGKRWTGLLLTREMTRAAESLKTALKTIAALSEAQTLRAALRDAGIRSNGPGLRFTRVDDYDAGRDDD